MKKPSSTSLVPVPKNAKPKVVEPEIVEPSALTVALRLPKIKGKTPGERINAWHTVSLANGKASVAAAIMAGWELLMARQVCDHGQWIAWLKNNTKISDQTARNYMGLFGDRIGAARAALPKPIPLEVQPSLDELKAASANVEAKSLSALYAQLRLLKRSDNHGGAREGAGRKPKAAPEGQAAGEAAQLDAIANNPALLYAAIRGPLDELWKLHRERQVFARLGTGELAAAQAVLRDLADAATAALEARS